jgi:hypothetical protein
MFSWLCCGSSDCAAPAWPGSLTGVCTEAVSGLPVRESVARPSLIWEPVELAAEEGWAPVALEGGVGVSLLALEARREGTGFCQRMFVIGLGRCSDLLKVRATGVNATRRLAVWAVRRSWKGIVIFVSMFE